MEESNPLRRVPIYLDRGQGWGPEEETRSWRCAWVKSINPSLRDSEAVLWTWPSSPLTWLISHWLDWSLNNLFISVMLLLFSSFFLFFAVDGILSLGIDCFIISEIKHWIILNQTHVHMFLQFVLSKNKACEYDLDWEMKFLQGLTGYYLA